MSAFEVTFTPSEAELDGWEDVTRAHGEARLGFESDAWRRLALGTLLALSAGLVCVGLDTTTRHGGFLVVLLVLGAYFAGQALFARSLNRMHRGLRRIERAHVTMAYAQRRCRIDATGLSMQAEGFAWSFDWRVVTSVRMEQDLLMFWITTSQTQFIPIRAFADADAARAALDFARDRIGAGPDWRGPLDAGLTPGAG